LLAEYLLLHYGKPEAICPWPFVPEQALDFPKRLVAEFPEITENPSPRRALEVGCATGRTCLELSRFYQSVTGVDFSDSFIRTAEEVRSGSLTEFGAPGEGLAQDRFKIHHHPEWDAARVKFSTADACNLPSFGEPFNLVIAANLICRLPEPVKFLNKLPELVSPEGILLITSPYTWLEEFTPTEHWLGGYEQNGREVRTRETLSERLKGQFSLLRTCDMPFMIREHARKYQWSVTEASLWRRIPQ